MSRVGVLAHALSAVEAVEREARRLWVELVALEGRLVDAGGRAEELRQLVEEMGERLVAAAEAAAARQVRALAAEAAAAGPVVGGAGAGAGPDAGAGAAGEACSEAAGGGAAAAA